MSRKLKITLMIVIAIAVTWAALAIIPRRPSVEINNLVIEKGTRPLLIAHGGGNREFPDNTLEACYNAYDADNNVMLELDVSITKDGVVILSHDTTLDYRTNATGEISSWNYSDLIAQKVDFSYLNFIKDGKVVEQVKYTDYKGNIVTPLDVPYPNGVTPRDNEIFLATTLEEVLIAFPNNIINVEIKQDGETGKKALKEVLRLVNKYDAFDRVILASFHKDIYNAIKEVKVATYQNLLCSPEASGVAKILITGWVGFDIFFNEPIAVLQVPMTEYGIHLDTRHFIKTAHRHNIAVHYWTIDDEKDMRYLAEIGADGIMTNLPHLLKNVLDSIYG